MQLSQPHERPATNTNPYNSNDMNLQYNPKRNAWYLVMASKCPRSRDFHLAY